MRLPGDDFHDDIDLGDVKATTHMHNDGTESLSFARSGTAEDRYITVGFQFRTGELKRLAELLLKAHAATETRRRTCPTCNRHDCGEVTS